MGDQVFKDLSVSDTTNSSNTGERPGAEQNLRSELPPPPPKNADAHSQENKSPAQGSGIDVRVAIEKNYNGAITDQHEAKSQADAGNWEQASTLYWKAITEADKIDRVEVGKELEGIRAQLKNNPDSQNKEKLEKEEQKLYLMYQAPVSTRTNYAIACYRYGFVQEGDQQWNDAIKLDTVHDLDQHPEFLSRVDNFRNTVIAREEAVGTAGILLDNANSDFLANHKMTPALQVKYDQAIKAADAADKTLNKPLLQAELKNSKTQLDSLDKNLTVFNGKLAAFEKTLPAEQKQKLTAIDQSLTTLTQQYEMTLINVHSSQPSETEQKELVGYEKRMSELTKQREQVYKLPPNLATEQDQLQSRFETARSIITHDLVLLHLPANARESYAQALEGSGQKDAAAQQREQIAASDEQFYKEVVVGANSFMQSVAGAYPMVRALDLLANNKEQLTPEIKELFIQARTQGDAQWSKDKGQLEADINSNQKALADLNQKDPKRTKGDSSAPESLEATELKGKILTEQNKLNVEKRMCIMARVYEAIALKKSNDPTQMKQADMLLSEVVNTVGATPQDIAQAADDVLNTHGMDQAAPIFKAAIDMADLANAQQQQKAGQQIADNPLAYVIDPAGLGGEELLAVQAAHPEQFTPLGSRERVIADAPVQTRYLYAVDLYNTGEKKEAIDLLEHLSKMSPDTDTIATLEVAKNPSTLKITQEEIESTIKKVQQNEGFIQQTAGLADMLSAGAALRFGAGGFAPVIGSVVGTGTLTALDYAIYGRKPSELELVMYSGVGWGIGQAIGGVEFLVTSPAIRYLVPSVMAKIEPVIAKYAAPGSIEELSDLSGMQRVEAAREMLNPLYRNERTSVFSRQYLFGVGGSTPYADIVSARVSLMRTQRLIDALGLGAAAATPPTIIIGVQEAASLLDDSASSKKAGN